MTNYPSLIEMEKKIDFTIVKIDLYNMYLEYYWGQRELSDSKIMEIERILILKTTLIEQLFMYVRHMKYIPSSVVSVLFEERVSIRYASM